jgi:6-phosphofructokinase 1
MKNIAILTSGGDSPGMNASIRAIVRAGIFHNRRVFGIYRGYDGLIDNEIKELNSTDVSNIIQRGGTILKSARSERFMHPEFRKIAFENLQKNDIDGFSLYLFYETTFPTFVRTVYFFL